MALIVRDDFLRECLSAGRVVEQIVLEKLKMTDATGLADSELEEAFEPIVKYVEERTEMRIRAELDEADAVAKQKKLEDSYADKRAAVKSDITGKVALNINGKRQDRVSRQKAKRIKRAITEEKLVPEFDGAQIEEHSPNASLSELDRETNLEHYSWSNHWDRFCPTIKITVDRPADVLVLGNFQNFADYMLSEKNSTDYTVPDVLEMMRKGKDTFSLDRREWKSVKSLLRQLEGFVSPTTPESITMLKFMTDIESAPYSVQTFVRNITEYFYQKAILPTFCGAYDCFDEVSLDEAAACTEEGCNIKICTDCWSMGREKCEEHRPSGG